MAGASAPRASRGPGSFGVIGQKPLSSSSSPSPARKPRARSPEPADQRAGMQRGAPPRRPGRSRSPAHPRPVPEPQPSVRIPIRIGNKAAAPLRLAARNLPEGFGASWEQHLAAGSEAVFMKLMGFVAEERGHHAVYPPHGVFTCTRM